MYRLLRPLLFKLGAEPAHHVGTGTARLAQAARASGLLEPMFAFEHEGLGQSLWGLYFRNPVGLAAGFDKNAVLIPFWAQLGFGFAEVGSVSARRSRGNPRPRAFRLDADRALVNRMGLNNQGAERIAARLRRLERPEGMPIGINLAKTHDPSIMGEAAVEDFCRSFRLLAPLADYVALNISCPNTSEGKTFEYPRALDDLLSAVFAERRSAGLSTPILVKLSPPLNERVVFDSLVEDVVAISLDHGIAGFIATNTASDRAELSTPTAVLDQIGSGGLSGAPIEKRSTRLVQYLYRRVGGRVPIIGVGGVASAEGAYAKIRAGASLVQLYTGLVYEGPGLVRQIKKGLVALLERDGMGSLGEAIGRDA
jgi:dihydroorotate dehydrogenase